MQKLIDKIKEKGYWKVIIRPVDFNEKRIINKDECAKIIEDSKIVLRGWDYPHIDSQAGVVRSGPDSVSSFCDWEDGGIYEYWKFYQNGQFVHYFSMLEDYRMTKQDKERASRSLRAENVFDRYLSVISALYSVTEIYLFAANLAKKVGFGKEIEISIELDNVENRVLFFWEEFNRHLFQTYICRYQPITEKRIFKADEIVKIPTELALDFTIDIFKEFNWKNANRSVFEADQKKLLERRI